MAVTLSISGDTQSEKKITVYRLPDERRGV